MGREQLSDVLRAAKKSLDQGRAQEAQQLFEQALKIAPASFEANFYLGLLHFDEGRRRDAIRCLQKVTEVRPASVEGWFNLGSMLREEQRYAEAESAFQEVLKLKPELAEGHNNLGIVYKETGRLDEAISRFEEATQLQPDLLAGWLNLGMVLIKLRAAEAAVTACEKAISLAPESAEVRFAAGLAYELAGQKDQAAAEWDRAIASRPEMEEWQFHRAAAEGNSTPSTAPREYIRSLFDAYAARFDSHLKGRLEYRAPDVLFEAVSPEPGMGLHILDLGCGTGLCGRLFRPSAARLVGVDLSSAMISEARTAAVYDALHVGDLVEYMTGIVTESGQSGAEQTGSGPAEKFDLILAADVFNYVGDLSAVFRAVRSVLRTGGRFVFTVEAAEKNHSESSGDSAADRTNETRPGYVLDSTRRYSHYRWYPEKLASEAGFTIVHTERAGLRRQAGEQVEGWIFVLN